jgi:hypothetical protein
MRLSGIGGNSMDDVKRSPEERLKTILAAQLAQVGDELLQKRLITKVLCAPPMQVIQIGRAKTYSAKVEIEQSADGKSVERAVIVVSVKYFNELSKELQARLIRLIVAHLACTMYFPHDPSPGAHYWKEVMYTFGYFRAPTNIPGYPAVKCQRKQRRR